MINFSYISPTPESFPLIAWEIVPFTLKSVSEISMSGRNILLSKILESIIEANFNCFLLNNINEWKANSEYAVVNMINDIYSFQSLNAIVGFNSYNKKLFDDVIVKHNENPHVVGWQLQDSWSYWDFFNEDVSWKVTEYYDLWKTDPRRLTFIKVTLGMTEASIGPYTYPEYLDLFQEKLRPAVWYYNYYPAYFNNPPLTEDGIIDFDKLPPVSSSMTGHLKQFFNYLHYFSGQSKKTNRPFWASVMCKERYEKNRLYPAPTMGMLRFEAYNALAMGAQALMYYSYAKCSEGANETVNGKLMDFDNLNPITIITEGNSHRVEKTKLFYLLKELNVAIRKYEYVFLNCQLIDAVHVDKNYDSLIPLFAKHLGCISHINAHTVSLDGTTGTVKNSEGFLLTHLKNGQQDYMVIVNHDAFNPQRVEFAIGLQYDIKIITDQKCTVSPYTGNIDDSASGILPKANLYTTDVEPGDMVIIQWSLI